MVRNCRGQLGLVLAACLHEKVARKILEAAFLHVAHVEVADAPAAPPSHRRTVRADPVKVGAPEQGGAGDSGGHALRRHGLALRAAAVVTSIS